jgi:uncharacterized protein (DUF1810 family)
MKIDRSMFMALCIELLGAKEHECYEWETGWEHRLYVHLYGPLDLLAVHRLMGRFQDCTNIEHVSLGTWECGSGDEVSTGPELTVWLRGAP